MSKHKREETKPKATHYMTNDRDLIPFLWTFIAKIFKEKLQKRKLIKKRSVWTKCWNAAAAWKQSKPFRKKWQMSIVLASVFVFIWFVRNPFVHVIVRISKTWLLNPNWLKQMKKMRCIYSHLCQCHMKFGYFCHCMNEIWKEGGRKEAGTRESKILHGAKT